MSADFEEMDFPKIESDSKECTRKGSETLSTDDFGVFSLPTDTTNRVFIEEEQENDDDEDDNNSNDDIDLRPRQYMFVLQQKEEGEEDEEELEEENIIKEEDAAEIAAAEAAALEASKVEQLVSMRLQQLDREYMSTSLTSSSISSDSVSSSIISGTNVGFKSLLSVRPDLAARRPDLAAKIEALQRLKTQMMSTSQISSIIEEGIEKKYQEEGILSTKNSLTSKDNETKVERLNLGGVDGQGVVWETFDDFPENYGELQLKDSEAIRLAKEEADTIVNKEGLTESSATTSVTKISPILGVSPKSTILGVRPVSPLKADTRDAIKTAMARLKISPRASPMAEALAQQALERGRRSLEAFQSERNQ